MFNNWVSCKGACLPNRPGQEGRYQGCKTMRKTRLMTFGGRLLSGVALSAVVAGGASLNRSRTKLSSRRSARNSRCRTSRSPSRPSAAMTSSPGRWRASRTSSSTSRTSTSRSRSSQARRLFCAASARWRSAPTEPSVSIHQNDVYIQAPRLFETEFFDIERLEILRGPQGTLFGRNATGGVINVITRKASTDAVAGYVDAEYGNYESVKVNGALNVPISGSRGAHRRHHHPARRLYDEPL